MDLSKLPIEMVEIIYKIIPNNDEQKKFVLFTKDKKNPSTLPDNDKFLYDVSGHTFISKTCPLIIICAVLPQTFLRRPVMFCDIWDYPGMSLVR